MTPAETKLAELLLQRHRKAKRLEELTKEMEKAAGFFQKLADNLRSSPEAFMAPNWEHSAPKPEHLQEIAKEINELKSGLRALLRPIHDAEMEDYSSRHTPPRS